jgi:hypothetical protein
MVLHATASHPDPTQPPRAFGGVRRPPAKLARTSTKPAASLAGLMGSLIKKRRKRMRKKKHKKMLKATRWQRRAGK